jgi:hypothetical protein
LQTNKNDRFHSATTMLAELEAAHKSLTPEMPAKVLKRYLNNTAGFKDSGPSGSKLKISPKAVIPILGTLGIGALVSLFIITGPDIETLLSLKADRDTITIDTPPVDTVAAIPLPPPPPPPDTREIRNDNVRTNVRPDRSDRNKGTESTTRTTRIVKPPKPPVGAVVVLPPVDSVKVPAIAEKISPIDELKKKYGNDDLLVIGKNALKARDVDDAIFALENVPASHPDRITKTLLLFDVYLLSGKLVEALAIANNESIFDAQFDFLCGRLYEQTNKNKKALQCYQTALTKPSVIRGRNEIRNDALYQTAVLWTTQHRANPTADTRIQALNAWNTVKRTYMTTPAHPRFKKANSELASIQ